jgi:hypothetical protein
VTLPAEPTAAIQRARAAARVLSDLEALAGAVGPELVGTIRTTKEEVERWLGQSELVVALAGDAAAKRAFLNAIVGECAFDPAARENRETTIALRAARALDYTARLEDGSLVDFAARMPDRDSSFAKAKARADQQRDFAAEVERDLQARVAALEGEAAALAPHRSLAAVAVPGPSILGRCWRWIARTVRSLFSGASAKPQVAAADDGVEQRLAALRNELSEARARVKRAATRHDAVQTERPKYERERVEVFLREVRALTDRAARASSVTSLSVVCPTRHLPAGIALVDGKGRFSEADGALFVAVGDKPPRPEELTSIASAVAPAKVQVVSTLTDLADALDRVRAERPAVAAVRAERALRRCMARVAEESAHASAVCESRIAALEAQRIPDPAAFRARQLERVQRAIADAARDVEEATLQRWRVSVANLRTEWHARIRACSDRREMQSFVQTINVDAPKQLQSLVDELGNCAIGELQRASETMQTWLFEEIHARYHLARRFEEAGAPAPVIGEAIDFAPLVRAPLHSALDKFETRRVGLGLGGAAAGAVLGSLIVPGVGTAIGAFVGVFAGWLKTIDSLKQECILRLDACLDHVQESVLAQIANRQRSFADAIRASLDAALDDTLERLEATIVRLMALEQRVLEAELRKRDELRKLRAHLDEHGAGPVEPSGPADRAFRSPAVLDRSRGG